MKKYYIACSLILSMYLWAGCSKDNEPSKESTEVKGTFKVDKIKGEVRYGYVYYEDNKGGVEYSFYDKDILKYLDIEPDELDEEFTSIFFYYDADCSRIEDIELGYKVNYLKETGNTYVCEKYADRYLNFSASKGIVRCSSNSIPVIGYELGNIEELGSLDASFSVEGTPKDITDLANAYTRGIEVREITDSKEIAYLKSIKGKFKAHISKYQL